MATVEELKKQLANFKLWNKRDGNWLDPFGCCKLCDGEIPYGHTENCDIWKMQKETNLLEFKLRQAMEALKFYRGRDSFDADMDLGFYSEKITEDGGDLAAKTLETIK